MCYTTHELDHRRMGQGAGTGCSVSKNHHLAGRDAARRGADRAHTAPGHEVAVGFLHKLHDLLTRLGRSDEWRRYIAELRQTNARKRRLLEMLDSVSHEAS
jgi:hypothetical protein